MLDVPVVVSHLHCAHMGGRMSPALRLHICARDSVSVRAILCAHAHTAGVPHVCCFCQAMCTFGFDVTILPMQFRRLSWRTDERQSFARLGLPPRRYVEAVLVGSNAPILGEQSDSFIGVALTELPRMGRSSLADPCHSMRFPSKPCFGGGSVSVGLALAPAFCGVQTLWCPGTLRSQAMRPLQCLTKRAGRTCFAMRYVGIAPR